VFELTRDLWEVHALRLPIVGLVEWLARAESKRFLPIVLPQLLMVFGTSIDHHHRGQAFHAMMAFGTFLEYLTLCLPAFVSAIEKAGSGRMDVARAAVRTRSPRKDHQRDRVRGEDPEILGDFPWTSGCEEYGSLAMDPIIALAVQLGGDFVVSTPMAQQVCFVP
jgi:hypothetical protein